MSVGGSSSSYWCHTCHRFIISPPHRQNSSLFCPDCDGQFIQQIHNPTRLPESTLPNPHPTRIPDNTHTAGNPVIVLRGHSVDSVSGNNNPFEMYYDDGSGSGLRPLPVSMSEFLLGSGFDQLLNQLTQIEANRFGRMNQSSPASKAAVEALAVKKIQESHISSELNCAICKDAFELQTDVKEMPCTHLYHSDCILPWLNLRNSCPVCRYELPSENQDSGDGDGVGGDLMIWRLPGGGFAVGRRGGFDVGGLARGGWGLRYDGGGGGWRRVLGGWLSCFGGRRGLWSSSSSDNGESGGSRFIPAVFSGPSRRRRGRGWWMDVNSRLQIW